MERVYNLAIQNLTSCFHHSQDRAPPQPRSPRIELATLVWLGRDAFLFRLGTLQLGAWKNFTSFCRAPEKPNICPVELLIRTNSALQESRKIDV